MLICLIFSINLNNINNAIEEIIPIENHKQTMYFGLYLQDFKGRVRVADVLDYTPAKYAGVEVGDRILEVNGIKIRNVNSFYEHIQNLHNKNNIKLLLYRVDSCSTFPVEINNTVVCNNIKKY